MYKINLKTLLAILLSSGLALSGSLLAAPVITIGGLDGAEHWTWIEAEDATSGTGAVGTYASNTISGAPGQIITIKIPP